MFAPIRAQQIPVRIRNSRLLGAAGTLIGAQSPAQLTSSKNIKAIAHRNHLLRIDVRATPVSVANGFEPAIAAILENHSVNLEIVARTSQGLSLACDEDAPVSSIVKELKRCGEVEISRRRAIVGCVGERLRLGPDGDAGMRRILKSFDRRLEWQQISPINVLTMIEASRVGALVKILHEELFES